MISELNKDARPPVDPRDEVSDILGWMVGAIVALGSLWPVLSGGPSFFLATFGLGLSILPPVVDLLRMVVPYWRWRFVPAIVFVIGFAGVAVWIASAARPDERLASHFDWDATEFGSPDAVR